MKLHYYPDTDSLYIDLAERSAADSREVSPNVVLDFDSAGRIVGIDLQQARETPALDRLDVEALPIGGMSVGTKGPA